MKIRRRRSSRDIEPNRRARPLRGASMDTDFGEDLEDDELEDVGGARGRDLDKAMSRYETFHDKQPIRVAELPHDLPKSWIKVGQAEAVMYRTDKWHKDGDDEDYKHLHFERDEKPYTDGKGVRFYEPASEATKSKVGRTRAAVVNKAQRLPVAAPEAITLLGYCLGFFVRRDDDGEIYEVNPRSAYLFTAPTGNLLLIYSSDEQPDGSTGFLGAMAGGKLRVLKDGIDG